MALPTITLIGQTLLVGTCNLPQYTMLHFPDGGALQVPLTGCSDERPDCCPSLNLTQAGATATGAGDTEQDHEGDTNSWTGTIPSPIPAGVVSLLSQPPLKVCRSDVIDLDPICCPDGFAHYGQSIIGNLPCVSTLTSNTFSVPNSVLASITSEVAASLATATASETPTVSVVINRVFALGLPCADEEPRKGSGGLSTGARAGIGAGVGGAALLAIAFFAWLCLRRRKHNREAGKNKVGGNASAPAMTSTVFQNNIQSAGGTMVPKLVSAVSTMSPSFSTDRPRTASGHVPANATVSQHTVPDAHAA